MNLQTLIETDLWSAIQSTYEAGNYSHAILDAMHYVSTILREKTGADGDGKTLVGQALGGDSPRLRINKLQTETEKNEQQGIESILRGMYQSIRNPRSHEQVNDIQETADAIIYFINYLLNIINKSEEPFVISKFLNRVFDPDFVTSQQYAELLVNEVPTIKRYDVLVAIYRDKLRGDIENIQLIVHALIKKLSDEQVNEFVKIVSDELAIITDDKNFRYNFHLLPPNLWDQLQDIPRLRAENRVIKSIKEGEADGDKCLHGALATWARIHFSHFKLKEQLGNALILNLKSSNVKNQFYVFQYFLPQLNDVILNSWNVLSGVRAISDSIRQDNFIIRNALVDKFFTFPEDWQKELLNILKDLIEESDESAQLYDGTPFLAKLGLTEDETDEYDSDIPF